MFVDSDGEPLERTVTGSVLSVAPETKPETKPEISPAPVPHLIDTAPTSDPLDRPQVFVPRES